MENALRIVSLDSGRDPRKTSMVAFGGAGPLHASRLAKEIGIPKVIIPFAAGLGSAIGLLEAQPKIDMSTTELVNIKGFAYSRIAEIFDEKINDGQLDNAPITFQDLETIKQSFQASLEGLYHQRVLYPEFTNDEEE